MHLRESIFQNLSEEHAPKPPPPPPPPTFKKLHFPPPPLLTRMSGLNPKIDNSSCEKGPALPPLIEWYHTGILGLSAYHVEPQIKQ